MNNVKLFILAVIASFVLNACTPSDKEFTGSEYMPDMGHSVAQEANTYNYYYYNTWDERSTIKLSELVQPRLPVKGTVPRGYAGVYFADSLGGAEQVSDDIQAKANYIPMNGHVPYYYGNTEEERLRASAEITNNPFPITEEGMIRGSELYTIYCGICHGQKGDGLGWLVAEENLNAKYPVVPANFLNDTYSVASNGQYYHAIMYGKNVMGSYADKLSYEERWQVIHYIRSLQAKDKKVEYSEEANTLNPAYGTPRSSLGPLATQVSDNMPAPGVGPDKVEVEGDGIPNPPKPEEDDHSSDDHGDGHRR